MRSITIALLLAAAPTALMAQEKKADDVYALGELVVTATDRNGEALGGTVLSGETLQDFNKQSVDQALSLIPGTNGSNTGGSRNDRVIYIRGFDRFQTTISIDGVRVFLPADNRIDFARFLTADISEIQVSKGYVSVLDGPGGLGGAINLVTIKPTKALEGSFGVATLTDQDLNQEAYQLSARLGGRTGQFYWQASGVLNDRNHYTLSEKYTPSALENGGARDHSNSRDWRANLKLGWQPNDTDEYSLNYIKTDGEKSAPDHVRSPTGARFWEWPYWNLDSLALLTRTRLTDKLTLKTRLYTNGFDNLLVGYDNAARNTQTLPRSFFSYYEDTATGGNVELDYDLSPTSQLKNVLYVRRDVHHERQDGFIRTPATGSPSVNAPYSEPWQTNDESTYSFASQINTALNDRIDVTFGASYDWTDLRVANEITERVTGTTIATSVINYDPVNFPLVNNQAFNAQAAVTWRTDDNTRSHFSVSHRTRFPTVFERFSARMGAAIPNPDVREEHATNFELGTERTLSPRLTASGALFYSTLKDALIQVPVNDPVFGAVNKTQNVSKGTYYGYEASVNWKAFDTLDVGGNYTFLQRDLFDNSVQPSPALPAPRRVQAQGTPKQKLFVYADWRPLPKLSIKPSLEYASKRYSTAPSTALVYGGNYTLVNLSADYAVTKNVSATLAVQNAGDASYELFDGFPEAGRSFYASLRAKF